ncbi:hypothetical protein OIU79_015475 [Salix purpurea]|uniref:Uncharacterized protein n=1 Tax=Salix purpurea TaxID=77065 RepID=A0A9Q0PC35_SALPP|nr:hypothetical protein OIU79_015475 [Salix purpurea]
MSQYSCSIHVLQIPHQCFKPNISVVGYISIQLSGRRKFSETEWMIEKGSHFGFSLMRCEFIEILMILLVAPGVIMMWNAVWEFRRCKEDVEQADLMHRNSGSSIIRMERLSGGKPPTYGWFKLWMELVAKTLKLKHIQLAWDDGLRMPYLEVDSLVLVMVLPERQCHATVSLPIKPSCIKANIKTNPQPKITDSSWSLSFTIST